jgi:DNA-binding transcriptional MocR family regulator
MTAPVPHGALDEWRAAAPGRLPERLAGALEAALLDGRLPFAEGLPSERALALSLGVSRATVAEAYALLRERGWLRTRRGARATPVLPPDLDEGLSPRDATPGSDVIDLTLAAPAAPAGAYLAAVDRARSRAGGHVATTGLPGAGLPELRALIAERHSASGLPTRPEQILVTTGALAALQLALAALVPARAPAVAELPTYPVALDALRDRGRRVVGWPLGREWDVERFTTLAARHGAAIAYVVADFHNPTGRVAGAQEREALARAATGGGILLLADETMRDLDLRDPPRPQLPLAALAPGAVTLGSLSKVVWGGLRVGWLRASQATVERLLRHPLAQALAAPLLEQLIATEMLATLDALVARRRTTLRARLDHLMARIDTLDGIVADRPAGGLSVWCRVDRSSKQLTSAAAAAGVRLLPGGRFSPDAPLDRNLRIPFALPEPALDEALDRLAPLL